MLSEDKRNQLNSVIGRMKDAGEDEDSIKSAVDQFKTKYDTPEPQETSGLSAYAPRTAKALETPEKTGYGDIIKATAGDVLSLPGRFLAALPSLKSGSFKESMAKPRADEGEGIAGTARQIGMTLS